jgi:hypothetical protein
VAISAGLSPDVQACAASYVRSGQSTEGSANSSVSGSLTFSFAQNLQETISLVDA